MIPVKTDATTHTLGAPANWNAEQDGECVALPIVQEGGYLHSFYALSDEECEAIVQGAMIRLSIFGSSHPPVILAVTEPPAQPASSS